MERIKLQDPGSELTLAVTNVTEEELGGGKYYKCDDGHNELLIPTSAADRQFDRIGIASAGGMVGKTIKFSRSDNMSKSGHPFWNLDLAKPNGTPKPPAAKHEGRDFTPEQFRDDLPAELRGDDDQYPHHQPQGQTSGKVPMRTAYLALTKWVLDEIAPLYAKAGIGMSPESAAAATATLFIAANQRGKLE